MKSLLLISLLLSAQVVAAQQVSTKEQSLFKLALESKYGHQPANLRFINLTETIDSTQLKSWVQRVKDAPKPESFLSFLEPDFPEFTQSLKYRFHPDYKRLNEFQNFFRWVQRFDAGKFVLINVASGELTLYENNLPELRMRVITGTRSHKTPLMATVADAAIVYPYWTPTRNIAVNEILPKVKEDIRYLERNSFEILDAKRKKIDPYSVDWQSLDKDNFNLTFRQSTGCDNALGLLKINIQNPYSVYMHDTPHTEASRSLFDREKRFFSHGCIRLQKPLELAQKLDPVESINQNLMDYCVKNESPKTIELKEPIPVFILYFTHYIDENGDWKTVEDYYKLR
ncbi:L,D-transpeptidase family protein [Jiulongibacter sediminis]|uniref:L,D-transpeptidase family protein n=1 Tax=Jiulongibacter sediminis TaxID=1605367 RepID=UPI0026EF98EC|nr:L,D-transpeptidase family protein [Jiulongibacter sediminis]